MQKAECNGAAECGGSPRAKGSASSALEPAVLADLMLAKRCHAARVCGRNRLVQGGSQTWCFMKVYSVKSLPFVNSAMDKFPNMQEWRSENSICVGCWVIRDNSGRGEREREREREYELELKLEAGNINEAKRQTMRYRVIKSRGR